ncbi:MAG: hypothetical protein WBA74_10090, partial [Cyclobacteriaceae bacterium]
AIKDDSLPGNFSDMPEKITKGHIRSDISKLLNKYRELEKHGVVFSDGDLRKLSATIYNDLQARVSQDPIALSDSFIYHISRSFKVIFSHRVASLLYQLTYDSVTKNKLCKYYAYLIAEDAATRTMIEIHPAAIIGERFVIDHGINTVIGATTIIGDDCTLLNNVLLGARRITNNEKCKRHPTLGNRVCIAGGARILGAITIGDDTRIGPDCLIVNDVPDNVIVKRLNTQQIVRTVKSSI